MRVRWRTLSEGQTEKNNHDDTTYDEKTLDQLGKKRSSTT
jgi:hypothetical protein